VNQDILRKKSWGICKFHRLPVNENLPLLETSLIIRPANEIINRALSLYAIVAVSFGFSAATAREWIQVEGLNDSLTNEEVEFLENGFDKEKFQIQVECLYALSWILSFYSRIEWLETIPNDLVKMFPDLKSSANSSEFRKQSKLRQREEIIQALDTLYCLHWASKELALMKKRSPIVKGNIELRRATIEWCVSSENWNEIDLST
jgi:hypothetical protein